MDNNTTESLQRAERIDTDVRALQKALLTEYAGCATTTWLLILELVMSYGRLRHFDEQLEVFYRDQQVGRSGARHLNHPDNDSPARSLGRLTRTLKSRHDMGLHHERLLTRLVSTKTTSKRGGK